ncbi:MAG: helix-turn-helix domain-containing protein [Patescibacteria group bacterium]|nr:helix-turn-helix domain-containing protein [Patescibacteria group bacterium]
MDHSLLRDINASCGIGKQLKSAREKLGWRLEDAEKKTRIRIIYLKALEEERFNNIPSGLYAEKYLKRYAKLLKLPVEKIYQEFKENGPSFEHSDPFEKKVLSKKQLISFPKLLRRVAFALVILFCVFYLLIYFKKMFFPPRLTIYSPTANFISQEQTVVVSGNVEAESDLTINDEIIPKDKQNNFSQKISLKKGINVIIIKAKKKYSREKIITRQVLVE